MTPPSVIRRKGLSSLTITARSPKFSRQSRVWVGTEMEDGKLIIHADSDSLITKGLIALFIRLLSGLSPADILAADLSKLDDCGLREHLASTRANALTSMAATIRKAADSASKNFLL